MYYLVGHFQTYYSCSSEELDEKVDRPFALIHKATASNLETKYCKGKQLAYSVFYLLSCKELYENIDMNVVFIGLQSMQGYV